MGKAATNRSATAFCFCAVCYLQLVAEVSLATSHGTVMPAFSQNSSQVAPSGVGVAQTQPSFSPFAHAVAHVAAGAGQGFESTGHVAAQPANASVKIKMAFFIFLLLPAAPK
jgi:hypothetical protein